MIKLDIQRGPSDDGGAAGARWQLPEEDETRRRGAKNQAK